MQKVAQAYITTQATTTSPARIVIMLYEGAVSFLQKAKVKIDEKNYAEKGILISKAMDIINELDSSLNSEKGGELANNLHSLYFFCSTHLLQANLKMDTKKVDEVITILQNLKSAFEEIEDDPEAIIAAQENAMTQRSHMPQSRPITGINYANNKPSHIGTARASSMYARSSANFANTQKD